MSLLPELPCRWLFIDSRFAEGTATDFTVNIPEAELDLGDNPVCYVDSISVPSIQNFLPTRNRINYEEAAQSTVAPDLSGAWVWSNTSTTNSTGDLTYTYPSSSGTTAQITVTSHASQLTVTVGNIPFTWNGSALVKDGDASVTWTHASGITYPNVQHTKRALRVDIP